MEKVDCVMCVTVCQGVPVHCIEGEMLNMRHCTSSHAHIIRYILAGMGQDRRSSKVIDVLLDVLDNDTRECTYSAKQRKRVRRSKTKVQMSRGHPANLTRERWTVTAIASHNNSHTPSLNRSHIIKSISQCLLRT